MHNTTLELKVINISHLPNLHEKGGGVIMIKLTDVNLLTIIQRRHEMKMNMFGINAFTMADNPIPLVFYLFTSFVINLR